jgi:perosamine synthetase
MEIRLFKPCVGEEELDNIRDVFKRAWLGLGPKVSQFEKEWSSYIGARNSIGVNSCTAALHLAITAFKFPEGKKILVPAVTFVSTALAVLYNRLEPVFVDVDPETISIDMADLERKYTKDCVGVIPVHLGGHPVRMDELIGWAGEKGLKVIEDCANSGGGEYRGRKLGTLGDIGCFSFEEKKSMTTGDGGMICSNDFSLIEPLRACRWVGIDKDTWKRAANYLDAKQLDSRHWYYEVSVLGYKYNMNDLMAAIGLAQLKKLDWMNERRARIIERYLSGIKELEDIRPIYPYQLENSAYWIFGVRSPQRDDLIIHLKKKGIATGVHFLPLPLHPLFKSYDHDIPVAKQIWQEIVTLPLFPELTDEEVDYVLEAMASFSGVK